MVEAYAPWRLAFGGPNGGLQLHPLTALRLRKEESARIGTGTGSAVWALVQLLAQRAAAAVVASIWCTTGLLPALWLLGVSTGVTAHSRA